jgi:hypothetical protein
MSEIRDVTLEAMEDAFWGGGIGWFPDVAFESISMDRRMDEIEDLASWTSFLPSLLPCISEKNEGYQCEEQTWL